MNEKQDAPAPDADAIMALADTWQEEEEHYDRYAGRHKPDAARAALRAAVERVIQERDEQSEIYQSCFKQLGACETELERAEQEAAALRELLGEAREELSDVEYDADPPKRVVGLLARIDAVLNHAKAD